jgi:hypothetical protein
MLLDGNSGTDVRGFGPPYRPYAAPPRPDGVPTRPAVLLCSPSRSHLLTAHSRVKARGRRPAAASVPVVLTG